MQSHRLRPLLLALGLLLGGCAALVQTPYTPPATSTPAQWQQTVPQEKSSVAPWWQAFNDPVLNKLEEAALQRNNTLAGATLLVQRAKLQAGLSADAERPVLSANASTGESIALRGQKSVSRTDSLAVSVSYEIDLWGKLSRATDAANWEAHATEADRDSAAWSLSSTTASLYWQIAYLNQRITLARENLASARQTFDLIRTQRTAGAISAIDVHQADQALSNQETALADLQQQRTEARHALALLFDTPPETLNTERAWLPEGALPPVDAGLPADLLGRRPDLRAAELRLRKTLALGDATRASYYPSLSLTGALGSSSNALVSVLNNPVATLGAGLTLPFLQWNSMKLNNAVSRLDYEKAVIDFRQTLYSALADVENALAARATYQSQARQLEKALSNASATEKLYATQYHAGAIPLKTWLDAQQSRREAEAALAQNHYKQLTNHATLCLALGGRLDKTATP